MTFSHTVASGSNEVESVSDTVADVVSKGRPPADEPLSTVKSVRFSQRDLELIERAAAADGRPFGRWVRDIAADEAERRDRRRRRPDGE
jgi:predicted DNA binding CopG/RHH family protein